MIIIGIDPGVHTGFAAWIPELKSFDKIESFSFWEAISWIDTYHSAHKITVIVEDPSADKTVWMGQKRDVQSIKKWSRICRNVGMNQRDGQLIIQYCRRKQIPVQTVPPSQRRLTKLDAETFKNITGYRGRTNEHGRDSAMLVFGK